MKSLCEFKSARCSDEIHSIIDFYESIPDYNELYHLPEEDFYSKIETLRDTCCDLKEKCLMYSTTTKTTKRKPSKNRHNHHRRHHSESEQCTNSNKFYTICKCNSLLCGCSRSIADFYIDLEDFRTKLSPFSSNTMKTSKSKTSYKKTGKTSQRQRKTSANSIKIQSFKNKDHNIEKHSASSVSALIKQTLSDDDSEKLNIKDKKETDEIYDSFSNYFIKNTCFPDATLQNYLEEKKFEDSLQVPIPTTKIKKSKKIKNEQNQQCETTDKDNKVNIILEISKHDANGNSSVSSQLEKVDDDGTNRSVPPRLNVAANLRISYLRNKYRDLLDDDDNDDKHSKSKIQSEWGIKTNSAWKILKKNKKGVDDILERFERRKIEEKYLQKEHELNMELMRQRVKSSPLLLEGLSNWKHDEFSVVKKHQCKQRSTNNLSK